MMSLGYDFLSDGQKQIVLNQARRDLEYRRLHGEARPAPKNVSIGLLAIAEALADAVWRGELPEAELDRI